MELVGVARRGYLDRVKRLMQQGVHVDTTNHNNHTLLYGACEGGQTDVAQYLLDNGASVDLGESPLIASVRYNRYDCVKLLLQYNADVNCTNTKLETPMSVALQGRHYSIILLLLQHNAIPPASISGHVAIRLLKCAEVEHAEAVQKLVDEKIIDLMSKREFLAVFTFAFERGSVELAERMLLDNSYLKIKQHYPYATYYSAKNNWPTALSKLFEKGVDINAETNGETPLYAACKEGHEFVVTLLLNNGADPDVPNTLIASATDHVSPLHIAVQQRDAVIVKMLLEKGAKIDQSCRSSVLHVACSEDAALNRPTTDEARETISVGQMSIVRLLLQQGGNINVIAEMGDTALYRACESGHLQLVQVLLEAGADVNLTSGAQYPLMAACEAGNVELINVLLKAGADVKCSKRNDETCLHAFINTNTPITGLCKPGDSFSKLDVENTIQLLLESGADVNACCSLGETALYRASKAGLEHIVRLLLEAGAEAVGSTSRHPLYVACERGYTQIVDLLLQHGANPNASSLSGSHDLQCVPICCAVKKGYTDIVDLLLMHGADASKQDQSGRSALICFIELLASQTCKTCHLVEPPNERNLCILKRMLLLARGDVNKLSQLDGRNALHIASSFGMCDVIMELIEHGSNCNHLTSTGESALDFACENGHKAAMVMLLKNGAKPEKEITYRQFGHKSTTPVLCTVAMNNSKAMIKMLLECGADVNASDEHGNIALHFASSLSVIETLLNAGANVNGTNYNGDTVLSTVCEKSRIQRLDTSVIEMLLKFGADPNAGFPLHATCLNDDLNAVQLLLAYGADANQVKLVSRGSCMYDSWSIVPSPLCIACKNGNVAMVDCLLQNGADVTFVDSEGNSTLQFVVGGLKETANPEQYDPNIALLLQYNAPVNVVSGNGETPLYMACMKGLVGVVKQLLDWRADIGSTSDKYPLLIACQKKFRDIAMMLLERGADANVSKDRQTPLKLAAANRDVVLVEQLITYGADVNQMQDISDTALQAAIRQSNGDETFVKVVQRLLENGAYINVFSGSGETPLGLACRLARGSHNIGIVQTLLEHGADPNLCSCHWDYSASPPLSVAVSSGNSELVSLLIKFGAKLNHYDLYGRRALHFAIGYEMDLAISDRPTSTLLILLSAGVNVNVLDTSGISPLFLACGGGKSEFVKLLLSRGADPNNGTKDKLSIHAACRGQHYESVKLLLNYKTDVTACDENGKTALHHAVESSMCSPNPDNDKGAALVRLLLEAGASVNATSQNGESLIYTVCSNGLTSVAEKMLESGDLDVNSASKLPLIAACRSKHLPVVQLLLTHGADPNVPEEGNVSLHIAAADDNIELVELLLKHDAEVDFADTDGNTALHLAIKNHYRYPTASSRYTDTDALSSPKSTVDILLENQADVNVENIRGETPLYTAVSKELMDVVSKMLYMYGGNPNAGSPDKNPLATACRKKNAKLVDMLLNHGADPNLYEVSTSSDLDLRLKIPLFIAVNTENTDIIMSLLNAGANVNATDQDGTNVVCFASEQLTENGYFLSARKKNLSVIRSLLQYGAKFSMLLPDGHSPLHIVFNALLDLPRKDSFKTCLLVLLQLMVDHGAILQDSSSQLGNSYWWSTIFKGPLTALATFDGEHKFVVDLLRAGAGVHLIASCCAAISTSMEAESIALCQAVISDGYIPSAEDLASLQVASADENSEDGILKQLVDWLNENRRQVPSLFRQCRIAVRRQLSTVSQYRTILPAIDQLPLPPAVKLYLQFDGQMTKVDLRVNNEQQLQTGETTDSDETSVESPYSSEQSDYDYDSDSDSDHECTCTVM